MGSKQARGLSFRVTHTHATAASASKAGETGKSHWITDVAVSSDKAGSILLVKSGTTTIWQAVIGAGNFTHAFKSPLKCVAGEAAVVAIDATAAGKANIAGYTH